MCSFMSEIPGFLAAFTTTISVPQLIFGVVVHRFGWNIKEHLDNVKDEFESTCFPVSASCKTNIKSLKQVSYLIYYTLIQLHFRKCRQTIELVWYSNILRHDETSSTLINHAHKRTMLKHLPVREVVKGIVNEQFEFSTRQTTGIVITNNIGRFWDCVTVVVDEGCTYNIGTGIL